jgi:hypothetical protein
MKNRTWNIILVLLAVLTIPTIIDCGGGGGGSTPPPTTGFKVKGENWILGINGYQFFTGASVNADWIHDNGAAQGTLFHYLAFTNSGYANVNDGRVPARWRIVVPGPCLLHLDVAERDVTVGSNQQDRCVIAFSFLTADPSSIDLASPPAVVSISGAGGGFNAAYGMPVIEYYDQASGVLVASTTAFSVATDGSAVQAYTPNLSSVYTGSYNIVVNNVAADGSNAVVGVAAFSACCLDPLPPDPPPDPPECPGGRVCPVEGAN